VKVRRNNLSRLRALRCMSDEFVCAMIEECHLSPAANKFAWLTMRYTSNADANAVYHYPSLMHYTLDELLEEAEARSLPVLSRLEKKAK
jgi:hypothetical protein